MDQRVTELLAKSRRQREASREIRAYAAAVRTRSQQMAHDTRAQRDAHRATGDQRARRPATSGNQDLAATLVETRILFDALRWQYTQQHHGGA